MNDEDTDMQIKIANECIENAKNVTMEVFSSINKLQYSKEALGYTAMMVASSIIETVQDHLDDDTMSQIDSLINMTRSNGKKTMELEDEISNPE